MDDFFEIWAMVADHIQDHQKAYILGVVLAVPAIFFTRKWSIPLFLYAVEICIYFALMHVFVHGLVALTGWFKENSSMRALRKDGRPLDAVDWTTPLVRFWNNEAYDPQWVAYMELAFVAIIVLLVFKFRPLRTQKPKPRFGIDGSKKAEKDSDSQAVANRYGRRRYADEWAKEAAKSSRDSRLRK